MIYHGLDIEKTSNIRQILLANKIKYTYRVESGERTSLFGLGRARTGSYGIKSEYNYNYYIYVHKNDYDKALYYINKPN